MRQQKVIHPALSLETGAHAATGTWSPGIRSGNGEEDKNQPGLSQTTGEVERKPVRKNGRKTRKPQRNPNRFTTNRRHTSVKWVLPRRAKTGIGIAVSVVEFPTSAPFLTASICTGIQRFAW